ncbi:hypothetical protein AGMMS49574_28480 [Bacteroidia bacterium]|nr:hypothetical protein AGMMS49574_28480 [Bacteroidia bacterium]
MAFAVVVMCSVLLTGCCPEEGFEYKDVKNVRSDVETYVDFVIRKEAFELSWLNYVSDGYTKTPLEGSVSAQEYDDFFKQQNELAALVKDAKKAADQLEKTGILKAPLQTRGLFSSLMNLWDYFSGSSKRARERVETVWTNLSEAERKESYKNLPDDVKAVAKDEKEFTKQLKDGKLDNKASQIHNELYHYDEKYGDKAIEKGLTIQNIVYAEGAKGVEVGSDVIVDVIGTLSGTDAVGNTVSTGKIVDNVHDLATKDLTDAEKEKIKDKIAGDALGMVGVGPFDAGDVKMITDKISDKFQSAKEAEKTTAPPASTDLGKLTVTDQGTDGTKADVVIAQSKTDNKVVVSVGTKPVNGEETIVTTMPPGDYDVTAIDKEGGLDVQAIKVELGKMVSMIANTLSDYLKDLAKESDKKPTSLKGTTWGLTLDYGPIHIVQTLTFTTDKSGTTKLSYEYNNPYVEDMTVSCTFTYAYNHPAISMTAGNCEVYGFNAGGSTATGTVNSDLTEMVFPETETIYKRIK